MDNIDIIDIDFDNDVETNESIEKLEIDEPNDLFSETYNIIDKYNRMQNDLKRCVNELSLLKIKYDSLDLEYNSLLKKYDKQVKLNEENEKEIKIIRRKMIENNKKNLMLRTFMDLIIKEYGMEKIIKITRTNEEQLNRYLK